MKDIWKNITTINRFRLAWMCLAFLTTFGVPPMLSGMLDEQASIAFWTFIVVMTTGVILVYPWENKSMANNDLQVWKVSDCDWYAARSFAEAAACYRDDGADEENIFTYDGSLQPLPLTEEELREMMIGDADDPTEEKISGWDLLQRLRQSGTEAMFFASTEW